MYSMVKYKPYPGTQEVQVHLCAPEMARTATSHERKQGLLTFAEHVKVTPLESHCHPHTDISISEAAKSRTEQGWPVTCLVCSDCTALQVAHHKNSARVSQSHSGQ